MHISNVLKTMKECGRPETRAFLRQRRNWIQFLAFAILMLQFAGCVSNPSTFLDDQMCGYRNHVWARRAYNLRYGHCDRDFPEHFRQGFIDGYCDVCNGGDGYVPAVPPEEYWKGQYQSPEGAKCVNTWFKAYPLGVKAAREDGPGAFHQVYTSKMIQSAIIQDKADHVLPDDVPVVSPDSDKEKPTAAKLPVNRFANDPSFDAFEDGPRFAETEPNQ